MSVLGCREYTECTSQNRPRVTCRDYSIHMNSPCYNTLINLIYTLYKCLSTIFEPLTVDNHDTAIKRVLAVSLGIPFIAAHRKLSSNFLQPS